MKYQTNLTLYNNIKSPEEILEKSADIEDVISKVLRLINENDFLQVSPDIENNKENIIESEKVIINEDLEYLPSNFSDLLLQLKCNYDSEDTIIKNSLREQHRLESSASEKIACRSLA